MSETRNYNTLMNLSVTRKFVEERQLLRKYGALNQREYLEPALPLPRGVLSDNVKQVIQKMTVCSGDIFICTYPKSGTTWMQAIVKLLMNDGVEDGKDIDVVSPYVDIVRPSDIKVRMSSCTLI